MKTKDWSGFFLVAIGLFLVWFWVSGKAAGVWAAIAGNPTAVPGLNTGAGSTGHNNSGTGNSPTQQSFQSGYAPPPSVGVGGVAGYSPNSASALMQGIQPGLTMTQSSLNGQEQSVLQRFAPPSFITMPSNNPFNPSLPTGSGFLNAQSVF